MKSFALILSLLFLGNGHARNASLKKMQRDLRNKENLIEKLKVEITNIEENVGSTNIEYLDKVKKIEGIEIQIKNIQTDLKRNAQRNSEEYSLSRVALNNYLIERLDDEYENEEVREKLYAEVLAEKLKALEEVQETSAKLLTSLSSLEKSLGESKTTEDIIYQKIVELENLKKEKGQKYISLLEEKNKLQDQVDKKVIKQRAKGKKKRKQVVTKADFALPIQSYVDVIQDKKGITFSYNEVSPLQAPNDGVVVYAGQLSSYGKVLMIDHGKNIRSVLLGDFSIKLSKGEKVKKSQILGYTTPVIGENNKLYFEIRKENKVQNARNWFKNLEVKRKKI